MKPNLKTVILLILVLTSAARVNAQPMSDGQLIEEFKAHPWMAAGGYSTYNGGEYCDTPAPSGYKAFYVSHLSRHGSRYQGDRAKFFKALSSKMEKIREAGLLTEAGDTLFEEIRHVAAVQKGKEMMLTGKGTQEHTTIAANLARRCPSIFSQKDRMRANLTSTLTPRTVQSLAGFEAGILSAFPKLEPVIRTGFDVKDFSPASEKAPGKESFRTIIAEEQNKLAPKPEQTAALAARLFKNPSAVAELLGDGFRDLPTDLFEASSYSVCLDIDVNPLRFFTPEELLVFYKQHDVYFNVNYGPFSTTREWRAKTGRYWLGMMLDEADRAIEGNGVCGDFRFAHDGNVGAVMNLLGAGPFQYVSEPGSAYRNWQSYRYICMASNVQLIFYRNSASDILVKALYQEREIDFPGLQPVGKVYYRWSDLRRYIVSRLGNVREVPSYYKAHLEAKSAKIDSLQKSEACGFYFITDTHFPTNYGNSAALLESLSHSVSGRPVVFGGDVITYLDDMNDGMAPQLSSFNQIRGALPLYWVRGNHDIVNYTGRKPHITKPRKALEQWDAVSVMARYTSVGIKTDPQAPYSFYYYFDDAASRTRFIVFESTDAVRDNRLVSGMSPRQLQWIAGTAVMGAPKGYHLVFFSHMPPVAHPDASVRTAADMINALAMHRSFSVAGREFDFSKRPDLQPLCIVCGHKHKDYDTEMEGGVRQINVAADCNYTRQDAAGTVNEQSFEYFSISKDYKTIRTVKIGCGTDRNFLTSRVVRE